MGRGLGLLPDFTPQSLASAVNEGWTTLSPNRDRLREAVVEFAGRHTGVGDGVRRPINLIAQAVSILIPNLVGTEPKHRVRSPISELRGEAQMLELALDRLWQDADTLQEVRQVTLDAILGPIGILRLGMRAGTDYVQVEGEHGTPVAQPFCRRISLDDYSCDPSARNRRELKWEAIRYRMPRQDAIDSGIFGRDPGEYGPGEQPIENQATRAEAEEILRAVPSLGDTGAARTDVAEIGRPTGGPDRYALIETIELWDVFLYMRDGIWTVTIPARHDSKTVAHADKWLLVEPWEGVDSGPLIPLGFCDMPDHVLFKPLIADWRDLHDFCRLVSSKLAREVENAKVVWPYQGDQEDDMMSVKDRADSGLVRVTGDPSKLRPLEINGIIASLEPALDWAKGEWANASGNLPLAGGQESGATDKTATAAQYLQANSSTRIVDMRSRVEKLLKTIDRHFGWYLTTDPLVKLPLSYREPGMEAMTLHFDAATRRGEFTDYVFDIERYSAVGVDPNVRLKRVSEFMGLVVEMMPLIQGGLVSMDGLAQLGRQEYGIENLDELLPAQGMGLQTRTHALAAGLPGGMGVPMPGQAGPMGQQPGMPGGMPGMRGLPAGGEQTRPIDAGRSALSVA